MRLVAFDTGESLIALGWGPFFADQFAPYAQQGLVPARVALGYNRFYRLYTGRGEITVELAGRLRHRATRRAELPAVGDWVAVRQGPGEVGGSIQAVLPRRSAFTRKVAGRVTDEQVVAANVDTVFLVSALDHDFNVRRIERYLTLAGESGATPVIILNKADLCADVAGAVQEAAAVAPGVPIHPLSSRHGDGVAAITPYLHHGHTIALLGSSGVGKSTLINRLLGEDLLRTQEVRAADQKGRHTTTHRELLLLPAGGLIMDTPGMREIQLWEAGEGLRNSFADVAEVAEECFFSDCQHQNEPGCAIREALEEGRLDAARVASYLKLQAELCHLALRKDYRAQHAERQQVKSVTRPFNRYQGRGSR